MIATHNVPHILKPPRPSAEKISGAPAPDGASATFARGSLKTVVYFDPTPVI